MPECKKTSDTKHRRFMDLKIETEQSGTKRRRRIIIGTEDIIAIGCVFIAIGVLLGVIFAQIEAKLGIGAIAAFASGVIISQVIKAKRKNH